MRTYYLALVDQTDTTFTEEFARQDEVVFGWSVSQDEADFAGLTIEIENPSEALLDPDRPQWVWLSVGEGTAITPLFFGRVVGIPADIENEVVNVDFTAKPLDFEDRKKEVAAGLRVAPFFDYAFVDPQRWDDPDTALEARTDVWHIDRVTNDVTISSIVEGEDGTLDITADMIPVDGFVLTYSDAPLRKVNLEMRAMWTQVVKGSIDITQALLAAFQAAGSPPGFVTSYTGAGLYNDWPEEGDSLGNVYTFGPQDIKVADGKALKQETKTVSVKYESAPTSKDEKVTKNRLKVKYRRWGFTIKSIVKYEAEIERTEDILFTVYADVQDMVNGTEDEQSETLTLSSGNMGAAVGVGSAVEIPIVDPARDQFWPTDRGLVSIEYGLAHARALLARRARAAEITVSVPFDVAIQASCRKSATVHHPKLPGGQATGKIIGYSFGVDGDSGEETGRLVIACMVGKATTFAAVEGEPQWADADWAGPDWQEFVGRVAFSAGIGMTYSLPHLAAPSPAVVGLQSVVVTGGETAQEAALDDRFIDIDAATDQLNDHFTEVDLHMIPLDTSPREVRYDTSTVNLSIPAGINLGGL